MADLREQLVHQHLAAMRRTGRITLNKDSSPEYLTAALLFIGEISRAQEER